MMSEYIKSLPKNSIKLALIFLYQNFVNKYQSDGKFKYLLVTFAQFFLDLDFQIFSLNL